MFCKNCGAQLDDGVKFCTNCGANLEGINAATVQPAVPALAERPTAKSHIRRNSLVAVGAVVVLVAGGIVLYHTVIKEKLAEYHLNKVIDAQEKGNYDLAIAEYTKAIKKNYNRSITYYTSAIKRNTYDAGAYYNRGLIYASKKEWDRAIEDFTQSLKLEFKPEYKNQLAYAYNVRGLVYAIKADYNLAITDWETVLRYCPDYEFVKKSLDLAKKARGW